MIGILYDSKTVIKDCPTGVVYNVLLKSLSDHPILLLQNCGLIGIWDHFIDYQCNTECRLGLSPFDFEATAIAPLFLERSSWLQFRETSD